ncbi:SGNH/GDSL hydrolase family protein [Enterovirga aerilata]|uniref:SGNH/GDSL hydrolase family protein n=1 Tax=Enterovirga aerilata TaxID=2730920 RepID=A0A849I5A3_9HYPH|nr:SGNH/GDSL hydrolase family protein [Enterovirga sp. DB1703]NNM71280.1 SGNH/GDSL hydrolase family protein [Enterovirga sp. DB1703]
MTSLISPLGGTDRVFSGPGAFATAWRERTGIGSPGAVPLGARLVTLGDSITAHAFQQNNPQDRGYSASGFVFWFLQGLGHRLRVPHNGNLAVSGNTLQQIRDSLGAGGATVRALAPDVVSFLGGTNNLNDTFADGQLTALLDQSLDLLLGATAAQILLWTIPPRPAAVPLSTEGERQRLALNAHLAARAAARTDRITLVDLDDVGLGAGDFSDNVHPNASGARKIGLAGAARFVGKVAAGSIAAVPPLAAYTLNPTLSGGSTVAPSWSTTLAAGSATVAFTKDENDRQRILISGSYAGTAGRISLDQYTTVAAVGSGPPDGAEIDALLDYEIVGTPVGINAIGVLGQTGTAGYANLAQAQSCLGDYANDLTPGGPGSYLSRAIGVAKGAGTPHFLTTRLLITFIDRPVAGPVSLDLRVNSLAFRRIG